MTLIEQLQQLDATLRTLMAADEQAIESAMEEVEAFRPAYISPEVPPRGVLAAKLREVEQGCKLLRERLGVESTMVSRITGSFQVIDPATGQVVGGSSTMRPDHSSPE